MNIAILAFYLAAGFLFGWICGHSKVAEECDRLGSFYVGSKVYQCSRVVSKKGSE
jgi:hypothetical protein